MIAADVHRASNGAGGRGHHAGIVKPQVRERHVGERDVAASICVKIVGKRDVVEYDPGLVA